MNSLIWKDIPGFSGYQISDRGHVRSFLSGKEQTLKAYTRLCTKKPYRIVVIRKSNQRKTFTFYIHRLMWEVFNGPIPEKTHIDHINGDQLDNRLDNFRLCTRSQNLANSGPKKGRKYKGVELTRNGRFVARITVDNKQKYLGTFNTQEEAAHAYNVAAEELFGTFAKPNFIQ